MFLAFGACALLATSCNKNDIIESLAQNEGRLSFNTALGKQTKAAELMNTSLQTAANTASNGIALYTYQETATAGTYTRWFNDSLYYSGGSWAITSTRFRNPAATKYVTYFPKGNVTEVTGSFAGATFATADKTPQFKYTIQSVDSQEDLVAGITSVAANKTDIVVGMRHILSQVNFGVKGYKGAQIAISNIVIKNVFNSATYTYKQEDAYPLGTWSAFGTDATATAATATYNYAKQGGAVPVNKANVESVVTGDVYIFGDGGNYGPGKTAGIWYPVGASNAWVEGNNVALPAAGMSNSLMLMPQDFRAATNLNNKDAYVTFNYTIVDIDGALVANNATGQFKLDFTATNASAYASQWQQNLRYVYIIDFTEFLTDNKLAFKVDVQTYPWENYDWNGVPGGGTGLVDVPVLGQATEPQVNALTNGAVLYAATCSTTTPTTDVQLITSETWHWDIYAFSGLNENNSFDLKFNNVIFNGKNVTINVPNAYMIYINGVDANTQTVVVGQPTDVVTIVKKETLKQPASGAVNALTNGNTIYAANATTTAPTAATSPAKKLYMLANQTWNWTNTYTFAGLNEDQTFNIDFKNIDFDGHSLTIHVPLAYKIYLNGAEANTQTVTLSDTTTNVVIKKKVTLKIPTNTNMNVGSNNDVLYAITGTTTAPTEAAYVVTNPTWDWTDYTFAALTEGQSFDINFSNVVFDGSNYVTLLVPDAYMIYIGTEENQQSIQITTATQVVTIKKK